MPRGAAADCEGDDEAVGGREGVGVVYAVSPVVAGRGYGVSWAGAGGGHGG